MLICLFRGMFMDEKTWKHPADFDPERFLENGRLKVPENYQPFGVGKHRCMGETLAKANIFLLETTLFQSFKLSIHEQPSDDLLDGATPSVKPYSALVELR